MTRGCPVKECPNLSAMNLTQKQEFWATSDPRFLRRLGDRLLAECLPVAPVNEPRSTLASRISLKRKELQWTSTGLAKVLGVSPSILEAWESDRVRPPDSLPFILERLTVLQVSPE